MTPEEIRAEAIERIARADYMRRYRADGFMWETTTEAIRGQHRAQAAHAVDALGDLLPIGREEARTEIVNQHGGVVTRGPWQYRYVTAWKEATE